MLLTESSTKPNGIPDAVDLSHHISTRSLLPEVDLPQWFQYGNAAGNTALRKWCFDFTKEIYQPAYSNLETLCHGGNTNAWSKVVDLLLEEGDYILCEEFVYPMFQALWMPKGNLGAPISLDSEGMRADMLEKTLAQWESQHPGARRPHVLYTVPVGSNPSGVTYSGQRKKELYEVCVKYDVVIVEDDPYYFLQFPQFTLGGDPRKEKPVSNEDFLQKLSPSFLKYDYQGRVIRLESFSKTLIPGLRLGYFVANPLFSERLLRASEVETQDPSGLSQAVAFSLLHSWGVQGYVSWLRNLCGKYEERCGWVMNAFLQQFELVLAADYPELKVEGLVAAMTTVDKSRSIPIFSFVPPAGGMFIWLKIHLTSNPSFRVLKLGGGSSDPEQEFVQKLWELLVEESILFVPGAFFHPWQGQDRVTTVARGAEAETMNLRLAFSMTTKEEIEIGIQRFASVVRKSWEL
ncbi:aromatic aminotransferase Aro8 [Thozetella sp. PMI_491]|nr:aromatic aminotransferase Aro8 [Thozetella sp. PMI_491]